MNQTEPVGVGTRSIQTSPCISSAGSFLESEMCIKICPKCGEEKLFSEFHKDQSRRDGLQHYCKSCHEIIKRKCYIANRKARIIYSRKYYIANKKRINIRLDKYTEKHPLYKKARTAVSNAIRLGKLIRPDFCTICGCECKPIGHHWSYLEENWLSVIWACRSCHGKINHINIEEGRS